MANVKMIPGVPAPSGASTVSPVSINDAVPNSVGFDALLDRMTGNYELSAGVVVNRVILKKAYYGLRAVRLGSSFSAPLRDSMDAICFLGLNEADSLINFTTEDYGMATNQGGLWVEGQGFELDDTNSEYIDLNLEPSGAAPQIATLTSMHFSVLIVAHTGTDSDSIVGRLSGNDTIRLNPTSSGGTNIAYRLNSENTLDTAYTGDVTGHWLVTRTGTTVRLYRNGVLLDTKTDTATALPGPLCIGRNGASTYHGGTIGGWSVGGHLTTAEVQQLSAVFLRNRADWSAIS